MKNKQYKLNFLFLPSLAGFLMIGGLLQANLIAGDTRQAPSKIFRENSTIPINPNATVITDQDGSVVKIEPDGTKIIRTPDNTMIEVKPDGTKIIKNADGTFIQKNTDGSKLITKPDGSSVTIRPDGTKLIKNADGSTFEVKADR